mgnify:CR=1 FL=1
MQKYHIPWIEKYRPKTTTELIVDAITRRKIDKIIEEKSMPNLIITGTPGIGKTTTIRCIARALYGRHMPDAVLELNASDDRGIKSVQDTITDFCKRKFFVDGTKYATHKLIILDEADGFMEKAQNLISSIMEIYHKTTRFAFTCNNSSDILESIQSRCNIMRYLRLRDNQMIPRLKYICEKENIEHTNDALKIIATIAQGDLRSAVNNLELVYNAENKITEDNIYKICDRPQPESINNIFKACIKKDFKQVINSVQQLKDNGFVEIDIVLNMIFIIRIGKSILKEKEQHVVINEIGQAAYIISKGNNGYIHLISTLARIMDLI